MSTGEPAGCWTDDTVMAIAILEVAAADGTLITASADLGAVPSWRRRRSIRE